MPDILKLRHWSYKQQGLGKQGTDPLQTLKNIIAIYSWHPSAALSLHARLHSFSEEGFYKLETQKTALRMPAMRLSVHMLPKETAAYIFAATVPLPATPYGKKDTRSLAGKFHQSIIRNGAH